MTPKHFKALANALREAKPDIGSQAINVWQHTVSNVANVCQQFNPNFDRVKFLEACGVNS